MRNVRPPAAQAVKLPPARRNSRRDVIAGDLTEDAAKTLMRFRRGGGGGGDAQHQRRNISEILDQGWRALEV